MQTNVEAETEEHDCSQISVVSVRNNNTSCFCYRKENELENDAKEAKTTPLSQTLKRTTKGVSAQVGIYCGFFFHIETPGGSSGLTAGRG